MLRLVKPQNDQVISFAVDSEAIFTTDQIKQLKTFDNEVVKINKDKKCLD